MGVIGMAAVGYAGWIAVPWLAGEYARRGWGSDFPEMADIPAGAFMMGTAPEDVAYLPQSLRHPVYIRAFAMGKHEVTNAQYLRFLNHLSQQGQKVDTYIDLRYAPFLKDDRHNRFCLRDAESAQKPVTAVSWHGALAYASWLGEQTGEYYRLPTEAEWEYVAWGGRDTPWTAKDMRGMHCGLGPQSHAQDAGISHANAFGVYDMLGNVWEWVLDCYQVDFYWLSPEENPSYRDKECLTPVIRGGSFRDGAEHCSPGFRTNFWHRGHVDGIGFRVAKEYKEQE